MTEWTPPAMPRTTSSRTQMLLRQSRALLEHLASSAPLPQLLDGLVRLIEEHSSDGLVATVLLADAERTHLLHGAAPSMPDWYNTAIDGIDIGDGVGSCGSAAQRRAPVIVADVLVDPLWAAFRDLAELGGFRACWSLPLIATDADLLGTFAMYYPDPRTPSAEDWETGSAFARTAALAIERDRDDRARTAAVQAEADYARRLSRLAETSLELAAADTLDELARIVIDQGVAVLDGAGGAVCVSHPDDDALHLTFSAELGAQAALEYNRIPLDSQWPAAHAARTGEAVWLPDRAAHAAWSEEMGGLYDHAIPRAAWALLPLRVGNRLLGSLAASWIEPRSFSDSDKELLNALAAQCAQCLDRIATREAQRDAAVVALRLSEALQRSLLTRPAQHPHMSIAVRYLPAIEQAQIGGDWYDTFTTAAGVTNLVIGDVNGHDRVAAAAMGQVRNLLRGLAYDAVDSPSALLGRLDAALHGLGLDVLATMVLVQAVPAAEPERGLDLRWASAGHPPPLLRHPDGRVEVLGDKPDLLLGIDPATARSDFVTTLPPGATLLLYTDGLVERRDEHLDEGIERLAGVLAELDETPLEQLCNAVIARLVPDGGEDDVALLAVTARVTR